MKQKFVNATLSDRRKGRELISEAPVKHPHREAVIESSESALPVKVAKVEKKAEPSELDRLKAEVERLMRGQPKKAAAPIPKSRIIGMAMAVEEPSPIKEYTDILAMLAAKK